MKINFDDDAIRRIAADAARTQADRLQHVYDHVLGVAQGKTEAEVSSWPKSGVRLSAQASPILSCRGQLLVWLRGVG